MTKRIEMTALQALIGTTYPPPFDQPCRGRERLRLGDAAGLTQYGVNLLVLPPGAWSSQRHWHTGEDEFDSHSGTIPQRLILMNGCLVHEKTRGEIMNAAVRIGQQASSDASAVETAYLAVLTRRPTPDELEHFRTELSGSRGPARSQHMEDLFWALLNSTEFSWNH